MIGLVRNHKKKENEPKIANGIDNDEELSAKASEEEIKKGDYTCVTRLTPGDADPDE